jgi:putative ABC transport system substrate-binding protein
MKNKIASIALLFILLLVLGDRSCPAKTKIAVLLSRNSAPYNQALAGFKVALQDVPDDYDITVHDLDGSVDEGHRVMNEIKDDRPALILSIGSIATEVAYNEAAAYPVVFSMVTTPRESGFISSFKTSKNNLTGVTLDVPAGIQFEALKLAVPWAKRIGVIYDPVGTMATVKDAKAEAGDMGIELVPMEIYSSGKVPDALSFMKGKADALWTVPDDTVYDSKSMRYIVSYCLRNRIPFMGLSPYFVEEGALMSVSADYFEVGKQSGEIALKIIGGAKPSSLPIERPRKLVRAINMRTAWKIGLNPSKGALSNFEKVIK